MVKLKRSSQDIDKVSAWNRRRGMRTSLPRAFTSVLASGVATLLTGCSESSIPYEDDTLWVHQLAISQADTDHLSVDFLAGDQPTTLELHRNIDLLAADAIIMDGGEQLTAHEAGLHIPFRGHVAGDEGSWVRVRVEGQSVEGLVFTDGSLWEIRASDDGEAWMSKADLEEFLESPTRENRSCATGALDVAPSMSASDDLTAPIAAMEATSCKQLGIALVADYTYVARLGGAANARNEMLNRINLADGIFRSDLNYGFKVQSLQTFAKKGGPAWNTPTSGTLPLESFSLWKRDHHPGAGLAHLFVARTMSGAVGKAWLGSTCHARYGSGVSNYLGTGKASTIVLTHEIGHNFGSNHDTSGSAYVMAPSVNTKATEFSDKSESQMNAHVAKVSCFTPCG